MIETCPFGVTEENACEDDVCQSCEFRKIKGKDIICTWEYRKFTVIENV